MNDKNFGFVGLWLEKSKIDGEKSNIYFVVATFYLETRTFILLQAKRTTVTQK